MRVSGLRETPSAVSTRPTALRDVSYDDDDTECGDGFQEDYPSLFIGPTLRAARERAGKRQVDIAKFLDVDTSVPSRWEGTNATRYKSTPGKYLEPLATFLQCSIYEIAPALVEHAPPAAGKLDQQRPIPGTVGSGLADHTSALMHNDVVSIGTLGSDVAEDQSGMSGFEPPLSSYTIGGFVGNGLPTQRMPGLPPDELRALGVWRRKCRRCKKTYLESADERAPEICECGHPLRARVTVSIAAARVA